MQHRETGRSGTTVPEVPPTDEIERWADLRQAGAEARASTLDGATGGLLDQIAFHVGAVGLDALETMALIEQARSSVPPYAWEQIAAAAGLDLDDGKTVRNLRSRYSYLQRRGS